ncbi:MAG: hypothetical protein BWX50_00836 [Euryarchaeota archaeon ADurb.Bin009]|nr:MAG: hypothetical protein BWX50_00836 [Euryarchaeota archaeon ADurb.Bin009]
MTADFALFPALPLQDIVAPGRQCVGLVAVRTGLYDKRKVVTPRLPRFRHSPGAGGLSRVSPTCDQVTRPVQRDESGVKRQPSRLQHVQKDAVQNTVHLDELSDAFFMPFPVQPYRRPEIGVLFLIEQPAYHHPAPGVPPETHPGKGIPDPAVPCSAAAETSLRFAPDEADGRGAFPRAFKAGDPGKTFGPFTQLLLEAEGQALPASEAARVVPGERFRCHRFLARYLERRISLQYNDSRWLRQEIDPSTVAFPLGDHAKTLLALSPQPPSGSAGPVCTVGPPSLRTGHAPGGTAGSSDCRPSAKRIPMTDRQGTLAQRE